MSVVNNSGALLETWVLEMDKSVIVPSLNVVCDGSSTDIVHR